MGCYFWNIENIHTTTHIWDHLFSKGHNEINELDAMIKRFTMKEANALFHH